MFYQLLGYVRPLTWKLRVLIVLLALLLVPDSKIPLSVRLKLQSLDKMFWNMNAWTEQGIMQEYME